MKKDFFLYGGIALALYYIYRLRRSNKFLAENCDYKDQTITFSETITQKQ